MVAKPHCLMVSRLLVSARVCRLASIVNLCAPCAKLQFPKIPLARGGGMWHTISVLPIKGSEKILGMIHNLKRKECDD